MVRSSGVCRVSLPVFVVQVVFCCVSGVALFFWLARRVVTAGAPQRAVCSRCLVTGVRVGLRVSARKPSSVEVVSGWGVRGERFSSAWRGVCGGTITSVTCIVGLGRDYQQVRLLLK